MLAYYRVYIRDREFNKIAQFITLVYNVTDLYQTMIDLMLKHSDEDFECIRVRFVEILDFRDNV
jgi:hypothetical protein